MDVARILFAGGLSCMMFLPMGAQVDLASQRKEVKAFMSVPGHKVDHKGVIINPVPHAITVDSASSLYIGNGFKFDSKTLSEFSGDISTVGIPTADDGVRVRISYGDKNARKKVCDR